MNSLLCQSFSNGHSVKYSTVSGSYFGPESRRVSRQPQYENCGATNHGPTTESI